MKSRLTIRKMVADAITRKLMKDEEFSSGSDSKWMIDDYISSQDAYGDTQGMMEGLEEQNPDFHGDGFVVGEVQEKA